MRSRTWIGTLTATTLVLSAAMVGAGSLSTANASGPEAQPAGTLTFTTLAGTATGDGWSYGDTTQPVTTAAASCTVTAPSGPLVSVSGTNGTPGFSTHSLGVTQSATVSQACRQVATNKTKVNGSYVYTTEKLTIALNNGEGGGLNSPVFGASKASSATLDIESKDESKIQADLYDGTTLVGTFKIYIDEDDHRPSSLPAEFVYCRNGLASSSYTDYTGPKDNCAWTVAPTAGSYFDSIVLTPLSGWFSLEGGGDWGVNAAAHRTTFDLVNFYDGTLDCTTRNVATALGNGEVSGVEVTRLDNGAPVGQTPDPCVALPYTLDAEGTGATFHKPNVPGQEAAQFAIAFTREFTGGVYPAPPVAVNWEDGGDDIEVGLCPVGLILGIGSDNLPTSVDYAAVPLDQSPVVGTQYACIYDPQSSYDNGSGTLTTTDWIYVTGDILLTTKR